MSKKQKPVEYVRLDRDLVWPAYKNWLACVGKDNVDTHDREFWHFIGWHRHEGPRYLDDHKLLRPGEFPFDGWEVTPEMYRRAQMLAGPHYRAVFKAMMVKK